MLRFGGGNPSVFYGKVIATFADPSRTEDCDPAWMQEFEACLEKELHGHAFDPDDLRCKLFGDLFGESVALSFTRACRTPHA